MRLSLTVCFIAITIIASAQKNIVDYTFLFSDKLGIMAGYEVKFIPKSKQKFSSEQKEKIFLETKRTASDYGENYTVVEFLIKRDSIETRLFAEIKNQIKRKGIKIKEIKIINLIVPQKLYEALKQKAEISKEPIPSRIKPLSS